MRTDKVNILEETLIILKQGCYTCDGEKVSLKLSSAKMKKVEVFLPDDIQEIEERYPFQHVSVWGRVGVECVNADSYSVARSLMGNEQYPLPKGQKPVLVLNLANPVNPGGGVRRGATAQEEDLCRTSSLLLSLESKDAAAYYQYNKSLDTYMGSDAIIITPQVEIIRDENGELLPESVVVSVMTCAAPMLRYGLEGMTDEQYRQMVYHRIAGMLTVAAYLGYKRLVLGAFGCGAFQNDAHVVSDLFYNAMKEFDYDGMHLKDCFNRIDFAVMDHSADQYNFREFSRNFTNFYSAEDTEERERVLAEIKKTEDKLDQIRGSLVGGAIGDALGYAIEFSSEAEIFDTYGCDGITEYALTNGKALISDDTQMTLFTANGILVGDTRVSMHGIGGDPRTYVPRSYQDWLKTQYSDIETVNRHDRFAEKRGISWLLDVPELYARRAPGNTCLSALEQRGDVPDTDDYIHSPINKSKGCGGVMRIAPVALKYRPGKNYYGTVEDLDMIAAQLAAITHSHSLGFMSAAVINHIISVILSDYPRKCLKEIVLEARNSVKQTFAGYPKLGVLIDIIDLAVNLSENNESDLDNIHALGEGWVAEETMAIAIYCALKYENDFSKAVTVSVNHKGDSDSTGAVTGNIVGAIVGYDAIADKWKKNLELHDVILELADDLCHGCQMSEYSSYRDPAWISKYMEMHAYTNR